MDGVKVLGVVVGSFILISLLIFGLNAVGLINYQFFGPKYEAARRNVFEETKSYRDGSRRDFENLYLQYKEAKSDDERMAVLSIIRERASSAPPEVVSPEIRQLLN